MSFRRLKGKKKKKWRDDDTRLGKMSSPWAEISRLTRSTGQKWSAAWVLGTVESWTHLLFWLSVQPIRGEKCIALPSLPYTLPLQTCLFPLPASLWFIMGAFIPSPSPCFHFSVPNLGVCFLVPSLLTKTFSFAIPRLYQNTTHEDF